MPSFVHISDIHFGNEDPVALAVVEAFVSERRPDFVIASGDLTAVGRTSEFAAAFAWLRSLAAPVLATPGNHDTPYFDILPRVFAPFALFHKAAEGVFTEPLRRDGFVLAPINTARGVQLRKNWALGAISNRQVQQAEAALRSAEARDVRIVITHHPLTWPREAPISGTTRRGAPAQARLIGAGADVFLSGHLHTPHIDVLSYEGRPAVAVSAPTLSIRQRGAPAGFVAIDSIDPWVDINVHDIGADGAHRVSANYRFKRAPPL